MPGGLIHANIATSTMFSATSGSSVATAATVATVAMPQANELGYNPKLFSGAIAAGGTLGHHDPSVDQPHRLWLPDRKLHPPAVSCRPYCPACCLALLFMAVITVLCVHQFPSLGGPKRPSSLAEKLVKVWPTFCRSSVLFGAIVGSIYAGWATPTEAATVGVAIALLIAAFTRRRFQPGSMLSESVRGAVKTSAMIMLVVIGAYVLNFALTARRCQPGLAEPPGQDLGLGPLETLLVIILIYIVLGFFIETLSLMVATIPIVVPIIVQLGYDKIWFGILMIILVEMALITPPVGLNLYVVQGARANPAGSPMSCSAAFPMRWRCCSWSAC
jgi:C4-dicarboxylate transporter DctM subunit